MTNLKISAQFQISKAPATGLTLSEINLYLTSQDKATGATTTIIWDGTQHPTKEVDNMGEYTRVLASADLATLDYFAHAQYVGATVLDNSFCRGVASMVEADVLQIEEIDATNQIRDAILTDATRFAGADIATIKGYIDTEIAAILAAVDTEVAAILAAALAVKAKTDNLPTDPADESNTQTAITSVLAAIAALNNPDTAAIVTAVFARLIEGLTFEKMFTEVWAQVAGDAVANDPVEPTLNVYDGPDGTPELTHVHTPTTRVRS